MPLKQSVQCGAPLNASKTCTKKTKHETGRCQHHRAVAAGIGGVTVHCGTAGDGEATAALMHVDDPNVPLIPLPDEGPVAGDPLGTPVLIADGQVEDSTVVAQRYINSKDESKSIDVLHLKLTPEGEEMMRHAIGLDGNSMVTQTVVSQVTKNGRHPLDAEAGISEAVDQIARSYNARLKKGEDPETIRETNGPRLEQLQQKLAEATKKLPPGDAAAEEMFSHYQSQVQELANRLEDDAPPPYLEGGKIPMMSAWTGDYTEEVTEDVLVPVDNGVAHALLPCKEVDGKRLSPELGDDGQSRWARGRVSNSGAPPKMWKVDLGDGYEAWYYPEEHTQAQGYSMRRRMHVIAGPNGDAQGALERLSKLHLNGAPATAAQAEFTYLERNAYALGLNDHPVVADARAKGAGFINTLHKSLVTQRAHEAEGMSEKERRDFVHDTLIEAQGKSLAARAKRLREGVATALGFKDGEALRSHPSYDPRPRATGSGTYMTRFAPGPAASNDIGNLSFTHHITGSAENLTKLMTSGATLASQERRRLMGTSKGLGMSESEDVKSGGGSAVFMHIVQGSHSKPQAGAARLLWSGTQAQALADRTDWYATKGDHFGATNPNDHHFHGGFSRTIEGLKARSGGQFMPEGGVCLRTHPPTWITTSGPTQRAQVIKEFKKLGVDKFADGRAVEDVVV